MVYTRSKSFYPLEILKTRHFKMPTIWQKDNIILNRFSLEIAWKSINLYIKVTAQHIICSYSIKVIAVNQLQEKHCGTPVKSNTPSCVSFSHFHPSASAAVCSLRELKQVNSLVFNYQSIGLIYILYIYLRALFLNSTVVLLIITNKHL